MVGRAIVFLKFKQWHIKQNIYYTIQEDKNTQTVNEKNVYSISVILKI